MRCRCELQVENRKKEPPVKKSESGAISDEHLQASFGQLQTHPAVNTIYAQSFENFLKHCFRFWWFSAGGNLGLIKIHPTNRIAVINPAWILVTVANPKPGFAMRLLIMIGVTVEPKEDPAVTMDVANERLLSK
ncbi:hypothetical protein D9756_005547 [Leucocoprinus leucothites]|uniref:Uncharacterized protein n=1 Tax=Leucocoprinus leucothites TaxID=201217 RepID=A0A8H5D737_9AGAR|nr:hypothetical protein D9756_005547 [Leucoagaricus leucothites]